jgi:hypothetical protein
MCTDLSNTNFSRSFSKTTEFFVVPYTKDGKILMMSNFLKPITEKVNSNESSKNVAVKLVFDRLGLVIEEKNLDTTIKYLKEDNTWLKIFILPIESKVQSQTIQETELLSKKDLKALLRDEKRTAESDVLRIFYETFPYIESSLFES